MTDHLAELRGGGTLVATGSFDLDPERAREKLARYQLADPHRYVLHFVQAAVLLGATKIEVRVDANEVEFDFDGSNVSKEQLEDLFLYAFGHRGDSTLDALRHLAIGAITAEAVLPARIVLETNTDSLKIVGRKTKLAARESPANRIYVRERHRDEHIWKFFSKRWSELPAITALRDARYATAAVSVNGELFSHGIQPPRDRYAVAIETPLDRGFVTVESNKQPNISLVQNGVVVEQLSIAFADLEISGVVEARGLSTNLAHSAFVRNGGWDEFHDEVLLPAVFDSIARRYEKLLTKGRAQVSAVIGAALRCRHRLLRRGQPVPASVDEVVMRAADTPIWRRLPSPDDDRKWLGTRELLAFLGTGELVVTKQDYPWIPVEDSSGRHADHILLDDRRIDISPTTLTNATARRIVDVTDSLQEANSRRARGDQPLRAYEGLTSTWPPKLMQSGLSCWSAARRHGVQVELGFPIARIVDAAGFVVVSERGSHRRLELESDVLRAATVLVVDADARGRPTSELLRHAVPLIAEALLELATQQIRVQPVPRSATTAILDSVLSGTLIGELCDTIGLSQAQRSQLPHVGALDPFSDAEDVASRLNALGGAAEMPLLHAVSESWLPIAPLRTPISYVQESSRHRSLQIQWEMTMVSENTLLWLGAREHRILTWIFGEDQLVDREQSLHAEATRVRQEQSGLVEKPELLGLYQRRRWLTGPRMRGEVGLIGGEGPGRLELVLLRNGKRVSHRDLSMQDGHFRAIMDAEELTLSADGMDVVDDEALAQIVARTREAAARLFQGWCEEALSSPLDEHARLSLWQAIATAAELGTHPDRARWRVFSTIGGDELSLEDLLARKHVVVATSSDDLSVIHVPLAPVRQVRLLRRLLPGVELDVKATLPTQPRYERSTPQDSPRRPPARSGLLGRLARIGVPANDIEIGDGSTPPRLVGETVVMSRDEALAQRWMEQPDHRIENAITLVLIAQNPDWLREFAADLVREPPSRT